MGDQERGAYKVTLNISVASPTFACQVSDRRLTSMPDGNTYEDNRNKSTLVICQDARLLVTYHGIGTVKDERGRVHTDKWIVDQFRGLHVVCPLRPRGQAIQVAVFEREAVLSTGIGGNVAIPHGKSEAVDELVLVAGRTAGPVDFDAIDQQPVRLYQTGGY